MGFWLREPLFPAAPVGFPWSGSPKCAFSGRNRRRFSPRRADPADSRHTAPLRRGVASAAAAPYQPVRYRRRDRQVLRTARENSMKNRTGPSGSTRCRTSGTMTSLDPGSIENDLWIGVPT